MKVGVWLLDNYSKQVGGGFSYYDRLIELIDNYDFKNAEVIFIASSKSIGHINKKEILLLPPIRKNKFLNLYIRIRKKINKILFKKNFDKFDIFYKRILLNQKIDIIYYLTQALSAVKDFPFIATNWDIGHESTFAFPELVENGEFEYREKWYSEELKKALYIFCESEMGKNELNKYKNINSEKIKVIHLFPGKIINLDISENDQNVILDNYGLISNNYFFYPAQFWAHKNHYNLVKAFSVFLSKYPDFKLVLTGSDKGNLEYIKNYVSDLKIGENVCFLGFVDEKVLYSLYKNARAMIMPTFLGPTNMPLLEAMNLGCPVLCSDLPGHKEMLRDGALYFLPTKFDEIAHCMERIMDKKIRIKLIKNLSLLKDKTPFSAQNAIKEIDKHFKDISAIRSCWG